MMIDLAKRWKASEEAVKEYYRTHGTARSLATAAEAGEPLAIELIEERDTLVAETDIFRAAIPHRTMSGGHSAQ